MQSLKCRAMTEDEDSQADYMYERCSAFLDAARQMECSGYEAGKDADIEHPELKVCRHDAGGPCENRDLPVNELLPTVHP